MRTKPIQTLLIIALSAGTGFGQTPGTWKMNPEKSRHNDEAPFPQSLIIRYEPYPNGETVTLWRVTQDGRSETDSYILMTARITPTRARSASIASMPGNWRMGV